VVFWQHGRADLQYRPASGGPRSITSHGLAAPASSFLVNRRRPKLSVNMTSTTLASAFPREAREQAMAPAWKELHVIIAASTFQWQALRTASHQVPCPPQI